MKEIPGYEGFYTCDGIGNVYSMDRIVKTTNGKRMHYKGKKLKTTIIRGYPSVNLCKNGIEKHHSVHRLLGITFLSVPSNMQINHIDGNKSNNNINNLEVCTSSENLKHAFRLGLKSNKGSKHSRYRINKNMYERVTMLLKTSNLQQKEISKIIGISEAVVSCIKLNKYPQR